MSILRLEKEEDYFETENMTREAFWDVYKPGCNEHFMLHQLRKSPDFVPELDTVAVNEDGRIVGNIIYSRAVVRNESGEREVLCMGPLSVLPECQKQGVGSLLLRATLEKARELGYAAVVIFGSPDYYHRFGFRNAAEYGIQTGDGQNFEAFMVAALIPERMEGISGRFFESQAFQMDPAALEEFEQKFPPKEKHKRDGQLFG